MDASDRLAFIRRNFGRVAAYHEWIYRERNLNGEGLFTSVHLWETGMDNTPSWIRHMESLDWGTTGKIVHALSGAFQSFRTDVKHAPIDQQRQPTDGQEDVAFETPAWLGEEPERLHTVDTGELRNDLE